jgi:hypothetical protein
MRLAPPPHPCYRPRKREHDNKKLSEEQLAQVRRHFGDMPVVGQLLGHIDYLAEELTTTGQYYEESLVPMIDVEPSHRRAGVAPGAAGGGSTTARG